MKPILLIGEAWGEQEARFGAPLVGPSGIELLRQLSQAGLLTLTTFDRDYIKKYYDTYDPAHINAIWELHDEVRRTNVFQLHPPGNELEFFCGPKPDGIPGYPALLKSKYVRREFQPELERLGDEILTLDPNLIIGFGNTPLWALAGRTGIKSWRGSTILTTHTVADYKLLPTYHPAYVLRDYHVRPMVILDLKKAKRENEFPDLRRPQREIWIEPSLDDISRFIEGHIRGCDLLSVDIETSGSRITCIGFAPSPSIALVVPFDDARAKDGNYWPTRALERQCWDLIRGVLEDRTIPKLFQNGLYDIAFLWRSVRIKVMGAEHDTMLLHHALQPESIKDLGFLGSVYSDEGPWKKEHRQHGTIKRGS